MQLPPHIAGGHHLDTCSGPRLVSPKESLEQKLEDVMTEGGEESGLPKPKSFSIPIPSRLAQNVIEGAFFHLSL